jgi:Mitochondrial 39-S ribosomal protein L47 (MRP-L47)
MLQRGLLRAVRSLCSSAPSVATSATTRAAKVRVSTSDPSVKSLAANAGIRGFLDSGGGAGATKTGRSWRTAELRLKSYEDLHRLWFVLVRERNVLLTEKEWCRSHGRHWLRGPSNLVKVKRSMARLKGVVGERTRAYKTKRGLEMQAEAHGTAVGAGEVLTPGLSIVSAGKRRPRMGITTRH